jgi:hypothetical protein
MGCSDWDLQRIDPLPGRDEVREVERVRELESGLDRSPRCRLAR